MEIHLCLGAASIAARLAADRRPAPRRCADLEEVERLLASLDCGSAAAPFPRSPIPGPPIPGWTKPPAAPVVRESRPVPNGHSAPLPSATTATSASGAPLRWPPRYPT